MKIRMTYILIMILMLISLKIKNQKYINENIIPTIKPIYSAVYGTIYHAEVKQCNSNPTITGDGSKINLYQASQHRWIAISQEMLDSEYRLKLLNDSNSDLYKGKIKYGDTVWIKSPNERINGWWIAHDAKNSRYRKSIDFLQTKGDGTLYDNNPLWSGKFNDIQIYTLNDAKILGLANR